MVVAQRADKPADMAARGEQRQFALPNIVVADGALILPALECLGHLQARGQPYGLAVHLLALRRSLESDVVHGAVVQHAGIVNALEVSAIVLVVGQQNFVA
jgi:hypothetical protein